MDPPKGVLKCLEGLMANFFGDNRSWVLSIIGSVYSSSPSVISALMGRPRTTSSPTIPLLRRSPSTAWDELCRVLPPLICWELWKARNMTMYEGIVSTPSRLCWNIKALLLGMSQARPFIQATQDDRELVLSGLSINMTQMERPFLHWVTWTRLPLGYVMLNIDGSSLGNPGHSGAKGILRDPEGHILSAFSLFLGPMTNMEAEALALLEGMRASVDIPYLHIEMDSQVLLNMVTGNDRVLWKLWKTVSRIKALAIDRQVSFAHTNREANAVANALAHLASSTHISQRFPPTPLLVCIKGLAHLDRIQMPYVRLT
ncbi:uncharacterized protein [Coffea arabica]|uniref:RNase H type-1 domain-containing protein n=1 Tax=Coffea arabica TaxID=13443 RepID=A0ABM4UR51_COFAR